MGNKHRLCLRQRLCIFTYRNKWLCKHIFFLERSLKEVKDILDTCADCQEK